MSEMILEVQIQKLHDMKNDLGEFCIQMKKHKDDLRSSLTGYKQQGFPKDIADKYEQRYFTSLETSVDDMISRIYSWHNSYIDGVTNDLMIALSR